jgi:Putative Flp pilus-assembly TadE/G-like
MNRAGEQGQVTAYVTVWVLALLIVAGLVIDGGYTLAARRRAYNEASAAARAGAQALVPAGLRHGDPTPDPTAATTAAHAYLAATGHAGRVTITGDTVRVTVSFSQPMYILGIGGLASVTVTGQGQAHAVPGVTEAEP